jgi:hypothetical protein
VRRDFFRLLLTLSLGFFAFGAAGADTDESTSYSPKFSVRTNNGILKNSGSQGGTAFSIGGLDLAFLYPVGPGFFLGVGYQAHFDFSNKTVPFTSLDLITRAYLLGQGTRSKTKYLSMSSERSDAFNVYVGAEFGRRDYYLGTISAAASSASTTTSSETSGNSLGLNGAVGADLRLSSHLQLTVEANASLINFAASDERYVISGLLMKLGVAYVW